MTQRQIELPRDALRLNWERRVSYPKQRRPGHVAGPAGIDPERTLG